MTPTVAEWTTDILTTQLHLRVPSPETDLMATGLLDSLGLIELLTQIEAAFGLRVDLETLDPEEFRTVERITAYVERARAALPRP